MRKHRLMQKKRKDFRQSPGQTLGSVDCCRTEHRLNAGPISLSCLQGSTPPQLTSAHPPDQKIAEWKEMFRYLAVTFHSDAVVTFLEMRCRWCCHSNSCVCSYCWFRCKCHSIFSGDFKWIVLFSKLSKSLLMTLMSQTSGVVWAWRWWLEM